MVNMVNLDKYSSNQAILIFKSAIYDPVYLKGDIISKSKNMYQDFFNILKYKTWISNIYDSIFYRYFTIKYKTKTNNEDMLLFDQNITFTYKIFEEFYKLFKEKIEQNKSIIYYICVCKNESHAKKIINTYEHYKKSDIKINIRLISMIFGEECIFSCIHNRINFRYKRISRKICSPFKKKELYKNLIDAMNKPKICIINNRYCVVFSLRNQSIKFNLQKLEILYKIYGVEKIIKMTSIQQALDMFLEFLFV